MNTPNNNKPLRKPKWLYKPIVAGENYGFVAQTIGQNRLHTICESGKCPNQGHCWRHGTATFMILGDRCTRACRFCATLTGKPLPPDPAEPMKVAESIKAMKLKHCVVTSVDRDDLPDQGAAFWAETVRAIRKVNPEVVIEVLIPDFRGERLQLVLDEKPDIVGHNLETVKRLTPSIRSKATYDNSMGVLREIAAADALAKTGIMVGLGETTEEVEELLREIVDAGVTMVTIGQYLQPTEKQTPVVEYVHPDVFEHYKKYGTELGLKSIESGPFVRSSFMAEQSYVENIVKKQREKMA